MIDRCSNPRSQHFDRYGGRGIRVCSRWSSFWKYVEDMGERPSNRHSLERIDNDANYEPGNCRWATQAEQMLNTCQTKKLVFMGREKPLIVWAREVGINYWTLIRRLQRGWSVERALTRVRAR
jgi:hypothetical protein